MPATLSKLQAYGLISTTLFAWTVFNAFRLRSNFFSAVVYLSKSNACMMILWNQGIFQTLLFGKVLQFIFFGRLRGLEVERLQERAWFAITETLLALTIFREEFDTAFIVLFVSLLFVKTFHWLASDRIELMEQTAHASRLFHVRMMSLLSVLWVADVLLLSYAVESILIEGPTVMIMFASEYMILVAQVWSISMKYMLNVIDMRNEEPWEAKSIYMFYVDLATDFFKLLTYITFFSLIFTFYGLPLNILRDVYLTLRSFLMKCRALSRYRRATRDMDEQYPNATEAEMTELVDKTCIICREDMEFRPPAGAENEGQAANGAADGAPPRGQGGLNDTPKKLACGHFFHFHCLRSWLERQQSCPTCRRSVLQPATPTPAQPPQADAPGVIRGGVMAAYDRGGAEVEAVRRAHVDLARTLGREGFEVIFPGLPFPPEAAPAPAPAEPLGVPPQVHAPTPPPPAGASSSSAAAAPSAAPAPTPTPTATSSAPVSTALPAPTPTYPPGGLSPADLMGGARSRSPFGATASHLPPAQGNPLAKFTLPNLQLPPGSEARLYAPSAGLGRNDAWRGRQGPFPAPGIPKIPTLEDKLATWRSRLGQAYSGTSTPSTSSPGTPGPSTGATAAAAAQTNSSSSEAKSSAETDVAAATGTGESASEGAAPRVSAREAAMRAAELRANASRKGKEKEVEPLAAVNEDVLSNRSTPTPARPPSAEAEGLSAGPSGVPRLVPLFSSPGGDDILSMFQVPAALSTPPAAAAAYTGQPLIPADATAEQLQQLSSATKEGIEAKLRVLMRTQDRMAALATELNEALSLISGDAAPSRAQTPLRSPVDEPSNRAEGKVSLQDEATTIATGSDS